MKICSIDVKSFLLLAVVLGGFLPAYVAAEDVRMAYLIGLGHYQRGQSKGTFRDMRMPVVKDIEAMGNALFKIGFTEQNITVLTDGEQPIGSSLTYRTPLTSIDPVGAPVALGHFTRAVSDALLDLEERRARGLIIFYFSGHGGMITPENGKDKEGERVLAFPNSHSDDPDSFARVYELLEKLAQRAPDVQKVLIVDACASKLQAKPTTRTQSRSVEGLPVHFFSSRLGQPSFVEPMSQSSLFTSVLADALVNADKLGEGNADGFIDAEEVKSYIERHFPAKSFELKRRADELDKGVAQKPWMVPTENLVLGHLSRPVPIVPAGNYPTVQP
jgi:hypothetical protein